jgi:alpha-beta hydrolase superfamily lysophospholipase
MNQEPARVDFDSADGLTLATYRWVPAGAPKAIAQIAHGVGEHARRYDHVAAALTAAGYVAYSHDHRNHGATARSAEELGATGADGWAELVADVGRVGQRARAEHPDLPLVLVAHSLGSFASQQLLLDHSEDYDAVAMSGTAALTLLEPAMNLDEPMELAAFNAAFDPPRTQFDWLSRDEAEVDKYIADPLCGFGLDIDGGKALFSGAREAADPERLAGIRKDLPVYIVVGDMDPVNGQLVLVNALVEGYRAAGLRDVTLQVWPGARHEVFNEINRDAIIAAMVSWLDDRITATRSPAGGAAEAGAPAAPSVAR